MSSSQPIHILLVDDRPENLISLSAILNSPGYRLVMANSGSEALRFLLEQDFALIIMDVQMPGMDGVETAHLIKQREKCRHIPIIFITANSSDDRHIFRSYDVGAVDYILKPVEPNVLRSKVAVFADLHRKTQELLNQAELQRKADRLEREKEISRLEMQSMRRQQEADRRYRDLVQGIHHGIVWAAQAGQFRASFVSGRAESILGYPLFQWRSEPRFLLKWIHRDDRAEVLSQLRKLTHAGAETLFEHRMYDRTGKVLWFQTGVKLVEREDSPGVMEVRGLSVDISHIKHAEDVANSAVRMRDEFLSVASHELKTPLTALKLQTQMLSRQVDRGNITQEKVRRSLENSEKQLSRLEKLIGELLDVSRIRHGKLHLEKESSDLVALALEVRDRFAHVLSASHCELIFLANEPVMGIWDKFRIDQVVTNLLSNACKYGASRPIIVEVLREGRQAILRVRDQGIGIAREDQERIFQQFERAVSSQSFNGLGLGLYIARQIIEAHGGTLTVESEIGKGSTFTVLLPSDIHLGLTSQPEARPDTA